MNLRDKYTDIKAEITAIYHENKGKYGYRRITAELHTREIPLNHKTVEAHERTGSGLLCSNEEIPFLQGRNLKDCPQSVKPGFPG